MAFGKNPAPAIETDEPATYDQVRGFKSLPLKDQVLAASIYAGFRQALREEREALERQMAAERERQDSGPRATF